MFLLPALVLLEVLFPFVVFYMSQVDPLFSKTSATFDEGGPRGLLLNQLATRGDTCEVVLDSNSVVMPSTMETKAATSHDPKMTDLTHLRGMPIDGCLPWESFVAMWFYVSLMATLLP